MSGRKIGVVCATFVLGAAISVGCAMIGDREEREKSAALPAAVQSAITAEFADAKVEKVKWQEEDGIGAFEVALEQGDKDIEVKVAKDGTIVSVEREIDATELPQAVTDALAATAPGKVHEATKIEVRAEGKLVVLPAPRTTYEVKVEVGGKKGKIEVAADGSVVTPLELRRHKGEAEEEECEQEGEHEGKEAKEAGEKDGEHEGKEARENKKDEEHEGKECGENEEHKDKGGDKDEHARMNLAELMRVAKSIRKHAPQAALGTVQMGNEDGVMLYEVKFTVGDARMEAHVMRDGKIRTIESDVAAKDLPAAVATAVAQAAPDARIIAAEKVETFAEMKLVPLPSPRVTYEVKVKGKGEIELTAEGAPVKEQEKDSKPAASATSFRDAFAVDKSNLADTGTSACFIPLTPGYRLIFSTEDGKDTLTIAVLDETRVVDGVKTRVVEERETAHGQLAEISRNFYAIDKTTGDVYYFGEEVDIYKDGKIVEHGGAWKSGVDGARFGLMMPGKPQVGDRFYQELGPTAKDRSEIVSVSETYKTPAGTFADCVRTRESSALESGSGDKWYAPGVGLVKDAEFTLSKIEQPADASASATK